MKEPLQLLQMDHTLVDVVVVDEVDREPIGRPWLTLAIDVATRAVPGFHLSLEAPSATSVALALAMAVLPKNKFLAAQHIDFDWPPPYLLGVTGYNLKHALALEPENYCRDSFFKSHVSA